MCIRDRSLFVNTRVMNEAGGNSNFALHSPSTLNSSLDSGDFHSPNKSPPKQSTFSSVQNMDDEGQSPTGLSPGLEIDNILSYKGQLVSLAKTHVGSRMLQRFYSKCKEEELQFIFEEIKDCLKDLMLDQYANFMFKNLTKHSSLPIRLALIQKIAPHLIEIACDRKGTHSLQAVVSSIDSEEEQLVIRESIQDDVLRLSLIHI
eukprot:TRINITY_DN31681_c0_g2_i1.p1 TRINITY_DN31681_c0_g2~~TRINITY_DN31681_c0_g2_i1.p1  ORF type:complete len:215 (+),score=46.46 TRINITY_DN31681_c0_g2_i1:35-646(+)